MIKSRTTLVLGAGASCPYGYPLATELLDWIQEVTEPRSVNQAKTAAMYDDLKPALDDKMSYVWFLISKGFRQEQITAFHERLLVSSNETIDRFLRNNPSHRELGKALISYALLKTEMRSTRNGNFVEKSDRLIRTPAKSSWYKSLLSILQNQCENGEEFCRRNSVQVITFNYDTSFEFFLAQNKDTSERFQGTDFNEAIPTEHVYGKIDLPDDDELYVTDFFTHCLSESRKIKTIGEAGGPKKGMFDLTSEGHVIFLGFHADPENLELLDAEGFLHGQPRLSGLNYGGDPGLKKRLRQFGLDESSIMVIDPGEHDAISKAIAHGILE